VPAGVASFEQRTANLLVTMKYPLLIVSMILLVSCGPDSHSLEGVPPALQDAGTVEQKVDGVLGSIPRSGYGKDLVEALFADVLEQDTALAGLLDRIEGQHAHHRSVMEEYDRFMGRNASYYAAAEARAQGLSDTTMRAALIATVVASRERFTARMAGARALAAAYAASVVRANDLITRIKVERTLALMESYQATTTAHDVVWKEELARMQALEAALEKEVLSGGK
jgi:hypothetical protein